MFQSTFTQTPTLPFHVAIIMDGNGRWAKRCGHLRTDGHKRGSEAVRQTVEAAPELGIGVLTLYAFSSDNWKRPESEINELMSLFYTYLESERGRCVANGIRLSVIGRRDRLSPILRTAIEAAETATNECERLHLRIAIDYSSRDTILRAASQLGGNLPISRGTFSQLLAAPDVDLLIRTGGEQRLSDFLLWESAYAELLFLDKMWPDFDAKDLTAAVKEFKRRTRRFGAVPAPAASPVNNVLISTVASDFVS